MNIFVKSIVFQHVELLWLIQIVKQSKFEYDKLFLGWVEKDPSYENKIFPRVYGVIFEDLLATESQDRFQLQC